MKLRTNLTDLRNFNLRNSGTLNTSKTYARVVDVVSSTEHPDYERFGRVEALGGIRFRILEEGGDETLSENLPFAYPENFQIRQTPLINEIVEVYSGVSYSLEDSEYSIRNYYSTTLNIWNNTNHNALPSISSKETLSLGKNIHELSDLGNLQSFPGDILIQGRLGNSLRFSGYPHPDNIYTDDSNKTSPITLISNSSHRPKNPLRPFTEDINRDDSSIYLTSNHTIPLTPLYSTRRSYQRSEKVTYNYTPTQENLYKGKQVVVNSGRVVISSTEDSVLLSGRSSVGLAGQSINLDSTEYVALSGKYVFLGEYSKLQLNQPVLRGGSTVEWLTELLDLLLNLSENFSQVTDPYSAVAVLQKLGVTLPPSINRLKRELSTLSSRKVFVE